MELKNRTDEELVRLYAQDNNCAFDELLNRHKNRVFTYIYSATKNEDLANDLFQETFIKAITTIKDGKYSEKGKFTQWINRIAHNVVVDSFRKEKSDKTISNEEFGFDLLNNPKYCDDGLEEYWLKENVLNNLVKLLDELPETQQNILRLRFFKNLSFKEIAEIEEISINTALGRMRYALINMKKLAEKNKVGFC